MPGAMPGLVGGGCYPGCHQSMLSEAVPPRALGVGILSFYTQVAVLNLFLISF